MHSHGNKANSRTPDAPKRTIIRKWETICLLRTPPGTGGPDGK